MFLRYKIISCKFVTPFANVREKVEGYSIQGVLTHILLTWKIWWAPNNASKWRMGLIRIKLNEYTKRDHKEWKICAMEFMLWSVQVLLEHVHIIRAYYNIFCISIFSWLYEYIIITRGIWSTVKWNLGYRLLKGR